jgi:uncharacterized membrane protein
VNAWLGALAIVLLAACGQDDVFGPPTGATCPSTSASSLTYANFGQPFMTSYCTRCHSSQLMGAERQGAPLLHDFDTPQGIAPFIAHIDETTASGPDATNTSMPPDAPTPTLAERQMLGEWLACGAP